MNNKRKNEDDYFIRKSELGELFDLPCFLVVNLWRDWKKENRRTSVLYLLLKSFKLSNDRVRKRDIRTYLKNGEQWTDCKSGGV